MRRIGRPALLGFPVPVLVLALAPSAPGQLVLRDVARTAEVDSFGFGRGAAMVDLDGDGLLDLIALNAGGPDLFFRQKPDHTFEDVTVAWKMPQVDAQSWAVVAADFDNDGDIDVFIATGGFEPAEENILLANDLSTLGHFTDVSGASGDLIRKTSVFGSTALDYDRDGLLDIFTCDGRVKANTSETHLFRNEGGLRFTEVTVAAGLETNGKYRHCSMGDFDNDGWPDIGVGHDYGGANRLFRNLGNGTFQDVASAAGVDSPGLNFGLVLEDFDNDGWLDVFLPRYQLPHSPGGAKMTLLPSGLFKNNGDGTFTDLTSTSGFTGQEDMGHNTGDLDSDGFPEVFIGTGSPQTPFADLLFRVLPDGEGGLVATDLSSSSGLRSPGLTRSHGCPFGDYDEDGDVDLYVNTGGLPSISTSSEKNILFQNAGTHNNWVGLELIGTASNRSAVGARAVATTDSGRRVHRHLTAGKGFGSTDSPWLHFGLGAETHVTSIVVTWPSGRVQTLTNPEIGKRHRLVEPIG